MGIAPILHDMLEIIFATTHFCSWLRPNRSALLTTLEDIHKAGVIHGDLCPQNLLIDQLGKASIIDFDQAREGALEQDKKREHTELVHILETLDAK